MYTHVIDSLQLIYKPETHKSQFYLLSECLSWNITRSMNHVPLFTENDEEPGWSGPVMPVIYLSVWIPGIRAVDVDNHKLQCRLGEITTGFAADLEATGGDQKPITEKTLISYPVTLNGCLMQQSTRRKHRLWK